MQSFKMCSNLSSYQLKIDCYKYVVICEPLQVCYNAVVCKTHGNHKTKTCNKLGQMDLTGIYRTFHPKVTEFTFFSSAQDLENRSYDKPQNKF